MDPFMLFQLMQTAQAQPEIMGAALAQIGAPPPGAMGGDPFAGPAQVMGGGGGMMMPGTAMTPGPLMDAMGGGGGGFDLAGLMKMPDQNTLMKGLSQAGASVGGSADQKPIMSGGVTRPQDAPQMKVQPGMMSASGDAILKLLLGASPNPLRVPGLGGLMNSPR